MATVIINDFVKPLRGGHDDDRQDLKLARWLTLGLGVFATGLAFYVSTFEQLIEAYSSLISLFNAPILALFLLGILSRRVQLGHWLLGAAAGVAANLWVQKQTEVHWIYFFPLSLALCFGIAGLASRFSARTANADLTLWRKRS